MPVLCCRLSFPQLKYKLAYRFTHGLRLGTSGRMTINVHVKPVPFLKGPPVKPAGNESQDFMRQNEKK